MNSFSIAPYEHQSILDTYKQWLVGDLYQNYYFDNINDPSFLQKLSFLQAEGVRRDIAAHAAITHDSIQETSTVVGRKIQSAANLITSSLDDGFTLMNQRMVDVNNNLGAIGKGINTVNSTLQQGNQILSRINSNISQTRNDVSTIASGVKVLNDNISQIAGVMRYQLQQISSIMQAILDELKIPESQRENRYHIEQGMRFFNKGIQTGNCLYFEDALDEFTTVINNDRKSFFSWYYIGMIHLYSKDHLDTNIALSDFDKYVYYADTLPYKHQFLDEAWIMKGECHYLNRDIDQAYQCVEKLIPYNIKASFRGMKYLSASGVEGKKQQAVEILKLLIDKNPFVIIQILEDYDLICNEYIIDSIREYKASLQNDLLQLMTVLDDSFLLVKTVIKSCSLIHNDRLKFLSNLNARFGTNENANDNEMEIKTNLESFNAISIDYLKTKKLIESKEVTECIVSLLTTKNDLKTISEKLQNVIGKWKLIESSEKRHRTREKAEWLAVIKSDEEKRLKREKQIAELRHAIEKIRSSNLRMEFELVDDKQSEKPFLMATRYLSMEDVMYCVSEDVFKEACCHFYYSIGNYYDNSIGNRDKRYAFRLVKRWIRDKDSITESFKKGFALYVISLLNKALGVKFSLPTFKDNRFTEDVKNKYGLDKAWWVDYQWTIDDDEWLDEDRYEHKLLLFITPQ